MIKDEINALIELQRIDQILLQLKKEAQNLPARREAMLERTQNARDALAAAQHAYQEHQSRIRQLELDTEAATTQIRKYRHQQMEVKTNESYRALEHEIATTQSRITEMEDQELVLMEQTEALQAAVSQAKTALKESEDEVLRDQQSMDERMDVIRADFEMLKQRREPQTASMDESVLNRYQQLFHSKDGVAIAPVRNGGCGGCRMKLTPQDLHDAHACQKWVSCPHCGRLVYDETVC